MYTILVVVILDLKISIYRVILFDLGGTLISRNDLTGQLIVQTSSGTPVDVSTNTLSASNISICK
jgi:hypothetical protein